MHTKKSLGQHFLIDKTVNDKIIAAAGAFSQFKTVIEIGPGMGALTEHILCESPQNYWGVELDDRFVEYLPKKFPALRDRIIHKDFLEVDLYQFEEHLPLLMLGNFPYNISTQIMFKIIESRPIVAEMIGMFQKEVALRIASKHKQKDYGILSVLTQAYYDVEYLFDVPPASFNPPPKVDSGVLKIQLRPEDPIGFDYKKLKLVVKAAFNQRRKTLRNSMKGLNIQSPDFEKFTNLRPEQCSVADFVEMSRMIL